MPGFGTFPGAQSYEAVDSHTEGMPTRVITSGVGELPGTTMLERQRRLARDRDDLRGLLMNEPRGHGAMSGAILQEPSRPGADWGVVFIEVSGGVTLRNVPSFVHELDARAAGIAYDMAFGGNFYAIAAACALGLEVAPESAPRLIEAGLALMDALPEPVHPENPSIRGCHHVIWTGAPGAGADARAATVIQPGWVDRSPCGTGTSARMAQRHARGQLALDAPFVHESIIGTRFTGRLVEEVSVGGRPGVIPEITGRAWITGTGRYVLDPTDPFPSGFRVG